jgi:mannose-6-phosphate isomerase-like protein (cupin superfamily)
MQPVVIQETDVSWEGRRDPVQHARSPIRWKLLIEGERTPSASLTVGVLEIPPGAAMLLHHHAPPEVYYVLEGEGQTEIDGQRWPVGPGTALFIPPNAGHRTVNTGSCPLRFLWVFPTDTVREITYHYDE